MEVVDGEATTEAVREGGTTHQMPPVQALGPDQLGGDMDGGLQVGDGSRSVHDRGACAYSHYWNNEFDSTCEKLCMESDSTLNENQTWMF